MPAVNCAVRPSNSPGPRRRLLRAVAVLLSGLLALVLGALVELPRSIASTPGYPLGRILAGGGSVTHSFDWLAPQAGATRVPSGLDDPLALSNDGSAAAYVSTYSATQTTLRVRSADGTDVLAGTVAGNTVELASFSGSGSRFAVLTTDYSGDVPVTRLYVLSSFGSSTPVLVLTDDGDELLIAGGVGGNSVYEIAFIRGGRVGLIAPSGGSVTDFAGGCPWVDQMPDCADDLASGFVDAVSVDFSPEGLRVVSQLGDHYCVMTRGTGSVTPLTNVSTDDAHRPLGQVAFSPDGQSVALEQFAYSSDDIVSTILVQAASGGAVVAVGTGDLRAWQQCPGGVCADFPGGGGGTTPPTPLPTTPVPEPTPGGPGSADLVASVKGFKASTHVGAVDAIKASVYNNGPDTARNVVLRFGTPKGTKYGYVRSPGALEMLYCE